MELKEIKDLIKIIKDENLEELKFKVDGEKIHLRNSLTEDNNVSLDSMINNDVDNLNIDIEQEESREEIIKSMNVGKIKILNVSKGMAVKKGTKLAQIATMGVESDVKSTVDGVVKDILVLDQSNVDFAKPLFIIEME